MRRGHRGGRPRISDETKTLVRKLYCEDNMTCKEIAKACNISEASLYRIMQERSDVEHGEKKE